MAKYKIIPSSRTIVQSPISIGHKAEKGVEAIEFDLTAWVETYGSGTATIVMKRWGDSIPYPVALEIDENNKATWTLSDIDTAKAGMAYAQLSYVVGDEVVKKSDIYTFRVMDSLTGEGEPPEAYESWLEHLTHIAAEAMAEVLDIEGIVTDKTLTVDGGIADAKATGEALAEKVDAADYSELSARVGANTIALAEKADRSTTYTKTQVDQMIEAVEVETDTTLTISGAPADAKKTGDALSALEDQFGEETDKLKADLINYNSVDILTPIATHISKTVKGVTYTWNEDNTVCTVVGTADTTGISATNLLEAMSSLPDGFEPGKSYYVTFDSTENNVYLQILLYTDNNSSSPSSSLYIHGNSVVTLPSNLTGIFFRILTTKGSTVNGTVGNITFITLPDLVSTILRKTLVDVKHEAGLPDNSDANDLEGKNEVWLTGTDRMYYNLPPGRKAGFLFTYSTLTATLQIFYAYTKNEVYKRRKNKFEDSWTDWQLLNGNGTTIEQIFNHYTSEATYNVSPAITTDVNNFLQPSGDNTDRKADIEALLSTGCCRLAPGVYYVSGIDMPEKSELIGSCRKTVIVLLGDDNTQGYAIHMNTDCTVKDLQINGYSSVDSEQNYKSAYNYVNRHGILWEGTYNEDSTTKRRGIVSGCDILNFSGGGITCYNTGTPVNSCLMVSDTFVRACSVGINIPYYSEFNIFTSVHARSCYYGCINNGGNNLFSVCNFSSNIVGMLMDNSQGQSPNNSHGSVVGCIFDHSNSNNGVGIQIDGCKNGEIFDGCQIFYSDIVVNNSIGIQFNNFNAGRYVDITVRKGDSGGPVLFNNWVFVTTPFSITVDDNYDACKFINCFDAAGNAVSK